MGWASLGLGWPGLAGQEGLGEAWQGMARKGQARQEWCVGDRHGWDRMGSERQSRKGVVTPGKSSRGRAVESRNGKERVEGSGRAGSVRTGKAVLESEWSGSLGEEW